MFSNYGVGWVERSETQQMNEECWVTLREAPSGLRSSTQPTIYANFGFDIVSVCIGIISVTLSLPLPLRPLRICGFLSLR